MSKKNPVFQRTIRRGGFSLDMPVDECFPLFTPEGERAWAEGWRFDRIHPQDGPEREGQIFRTCDARSMEMTWRILRLDPPRAASYYVVTGGSHISEVHVTLAAQEDGGTYVGVEYAYIPLGPKGEEYIATVTEEAYRDRMRSWKAEIEAARAVA